MFTQYLIAFAILFILLLVHDYVTDSRSKGAWARALVLSIVWVGVGAAAQEFGIIAWLIGFPLLIMALREVMGYSTIGAFFFTITISLIFHVLTVSGLGMLQ
jgi:hypothetical protein